MDFIGRALFFLGALLFTACCSSTQKTGGNELPFELPVLYNSEYKSYSEVSVDTVGYLSEVFPRVVGKYRFTDSLDVRNSIEDTTFLNDYFFDDFSKYEIIDSLDVNGLELVADYKTTVLLQDHYLDDSLFYEYYPVFLVNSTRTEKLFLAKNNYAYSIQEAKFIKKNRSYHNWYAIEGLGWDWCGNGNWGVVVRPQEFILILMRKYRGDYYTHIRVRLRNGPTTYVSKGFPGVINESQFTIRVESFLEELVNKEQGFAADDVFFGSYPKWD